MKCSRCDCEMTALTANDVPFQHCAKCGGMWFEVNAIDRVMEHGLGSLPMLAELPAEPPSRAACPACGIPLHDMKTLGPPRLRVLACKVCHGRWLDAQELKAHRESGVLGGLRRLFGGLAPRTPRGEGE